MEQCGVSGLPGVTIVEFGNAKVLKQVLHNVISERSKNNTNVGGCLIPSNPTA
jgi:hypothetical protein